MYSRKFFLLVSIGFLLFLSCSDDSSVDPEELFKYPLEIGNKWTYSTEVYSFNFRFEDPNVDTSSFAFRLNGVQTAEIIRKETLLDSIEAHVFSTTLVENGITGQSQHYINNKEDGLYHYAYMNIGATRIIVPKKTNVGKIRFNGRTYSSINEIREDVKSSFSKLANNNSDSLIIESSPLQRIKYPLSEQVSEWIYRNSGEPFIIAKKYIGRETITIPSGEYNCYKLQWLYDFNNDNVWDDHIQFFDYISEKGLIKRSILFENVTLDNPDGSSGSFNSIEEIILTDVNF